MRRASLEDVASESDVVFVLTPGGQATQNLVNEAFLRKMKKTAVLVNTSRGSVVDSDALAKALREGWIWAAGLDVVAGEPNIQTDHPLIQEPRLFFLDFSVQYIMFMFFIFFLFSRCVILPHIGSATLQTRWDMAALAVKNVLAAISGSEMPASVDMNTI